MGNDELKTNCGRDWLRIDPRIGHCGSVVDGCGHVETGVALSRMSVPLSKEMGLSKLRIGKAKFRIDVATYIGGQDAYDTFSAG